MKEDLPAIIKSLVIGTLFGVGASWAGLPLAWMLGPMIGTTALATLGHRVHQPNAFPAVALPVIGVMLGSRVSSELLGQAGEFAVTLALLLPFVALSATASYVFYRRVAGFDTVTAFFSGMPGGLNDMLILGAAAGGDERRIGLAHAARILCVIGFVAAYFGYVLGIRSGSAGVVWLPVSGLTWQQAGWLSGAAVLGLPLGRLLRLPAPQMLGPMALSGAIHVASIVQVPPPTIIVIAAQIVLGIRIGSRFNGVGFGFVMRNLAYGAVSSVLMIAVALGFAMLVTRLVGIDTNQAFLAFSPGGLIEMSLLALALGQEAAYVTLAHVVRIVLVIFGAPLAFRVIRGKR